jgi:hypothetical protein
MQIMLENVAPMFTRARSGMALRQRHDVADFIFLK